MLNKLPNATEGHLTELDLPIIKDVIEIVKPSSILEIGFNAGHSASMWLEYSNAELLSVDIGHHDYTKIGVEVIKNSEYANRFTYLEVNSMFAGLFIPKKEYDLVFIDGCHEELFVASDIQLALCQRPKYILIDDFDTQVRRISELMLPPAWICKDYSLGQIKKRLYKLNYTQETV